MRVSPSLTRLVSTLRNNNWPNDQIRELLSNVPQHLLDQLLGDNGGSQ